VEDSSPARGSHLPVTPSRTARPRACAASKEGLATTFGLAFLLLLGGSGRLVDNRISQC
jgi:hypothetical protein